MEMEVYFDNITRVGDLSLEYTFYEYEEPVLFVCTDKHGKRYLCSCCALSKQWIFASVSEDKLIQMIDNKICLEDMFVPAETNVINWDGNSFRVRAYDLEADNLLPRHNAKLDLPTNRTDSYRKVLQEAVHASLSALWESVLSTVLTVNTYFSFLSSYTANPDKIESMETFSVQVSNSPYQKNAQSDLPGADVERSYYAAA